MAIELKDIKIPNPEQTYQIRLLDEQYQFKGLKALLGAADYDKAGERNAGLAAKSEAHREAARTILSELTLKHLYENPLTDDRGMIDSVMRVNYDIDFKGFQKIEHLTVGELKNKLLKAENPNFGPSLTGVMAAAVTKLMDTHELVYAAKKIKKTTQARTQLGLPGTLSSRLQPNHPTDDLRGISFLVYAGLSMGSGDALIGMNPAIDTVDNVSSVLHHLDKLRKKTGAPTQICVLAHIKTQMQCLKQGAPVEIMFQSLAGTEATNLSEFDISVEVLDEAYQLMKEKGPIRNAKQFMYFETGQGSEFTYGKHNGIDMTTTEALCYGLARRYDPFMVNNVTGFIGPETHADNFEMIISNLQDHFMGKLLGLPMGMAPCYTLHSNITLEGQQMATQMLTAAGANYYMDVYLNTDRMLAYFDTSSHDNQSLREIYEKTPAPEFLEWALEKRLYKKENGKIIRGPQWGKIDTFCSQTELQELIENTPSLHGFENAGPRPADKVSRDIRANQAVARSAIYSELDLDKLQTITGGKVVHTAANSKAVHLNSPDLGAQITNSQSIEATGKQIQIVLSDGLSAEAIHHNIERLYPVLMDGLTAKGFSIGQTIICPYGRVKLADAIAKTTGAELVLLLIGERPGGTAMASRSLSCYYAYQLKAPFQTLAAQFSGNENIQFEYSVLSNIYDGGTPPLEAGSVIVEMADRILSHHAAGNRLAHLIENQNH